MTAVDDADSREEEEAATENAAAEAGASSPLLFGSGQSAWLAVLTMGVGLALALSVTAIIMASDGGGDGDGSSLAGGGGPRTDLEVSMTEFAFDPESATLVASTEVPVTVSNDGSVEHNWTVLAEPVSSADQIGETEELFGLEAQPGESAEGSVTLDPGSYQLVCTIAGHFEAGMVGELTVE
ncbi:MAG: cupredoxin domain-containing protein [Acidimicrobiales bacterium]|nr:cupredoxin domain-containing protein [Acidimicrobiales bacterium]